MESGNGGASSKGVLVPVTATSDAFLNSVLAPLKSSYLYEESKQSFRYKSAVLIKNPTLEEKYNTFRSKRREEGYSEEDLKESYGFLLFDDASKANALGETGVLTGNSTCTILGDPSKGVYISMFSDCLDLNRWYHGKSGYIAIIRLTKGRVNRVLENYTQNFTAPTEGFDCHVSEQLPSVSAKTSSFLAFERTQYYMYELLHDGSSAQSPSAACPVAIVSFSYTDTKATLVAPQEKSEENKLVCHYFPWRGRLEIGTHFYDVGLRSTAGASISAELPPVVKVDRAISMLDLRQLLPKAVFETCFSGEVSLEGLYCTLCELVPSEVEENSSFSLLLWEIREKDVALTVPLNDGGFLILLHSSHFLTYDDTGSSAPEVLQGMFVFPDSRVIYRDTKFVQKKPVISSEILRVLPVLSYAEGEVEKAPNDPSEELCEVFVQHMQSYAALINPGLALSPSRDVSIFPDQYDVPDDHKHLYSTPEWTNRAWQNFRSYLSKPVSFQLPLSKASEILAAGQEERIEDLDDDVYFCLSSPEEAPVNHVSMGSEDQLTGQKSAVNVETPVDSCITSGEAQVDLTGVPQNVSPDDLQAGDATKDNDRSDLTVLIKTDNMGTKNLLIPSTSDDLPAELIVSITSAEPTVTDASFSGSTESTTKLNDFQRSGFSTSKLQMAEMNSLDDETVKTKKLHDCPEVNNVTKTKRRKRRGRSKGWKKVPKACIETPGLQTVKIPVEDDNLKSQKEDQAQESSSHPQLRNPPNIDWRKGPRQKRKYGKLSSQNTKLRSASVGLAVMEKKKSSPGQQSFGSTILMELESFPLRRKTERWDLKPVISECGRILVPHGSVDMADQIKSLKDKLQSTKNEQSSEKMLVDASVNARDEVEMEQEASTALETAVDETEATASNDGGNNLQNVIVNHLDSEHSILRSSDDGSGSLTLNPKSSEHFSKNDDTDTPSLKAVQEKHTDTPSPAATKSEFLLSKLKSVLLRGKRKTVIPVSAERTAETAQDTEPCLKKGKVDADSGMLKSNDAITSVQDTNLGVKEVSKMVSVDPVFAYALGLTPKETPDNKIEKSKGQDTQQKQDSSEKQEQTIPDKQPQIIQRPLSIFPRRSRIKTLKKHQGVSAEHVKKKWWLHFQTPACYASEKYKECTRDNTVRKTVKEKSSSACSSTDALTLLADLALSVSNDQVPPHPDPALERKPETSLKKCDLTKDEQESVLHALLRQPAARSIQPLECPSPSHLVRGSELVGLVSKEHDYSLPPSSSLLLGLSGTPFQVSPLSGSTRLLHHHQTMYGDGIKILHRSVKDEDRSEHNHRTPEYLKKQMGCRRKFRNFRTFVKKEGSIQVTKEWKENYDFNLDSKFTSDSKDRAIIRALHGPWDFSIQDTSEEVRLIVHMWIGLFYSRSTARFFHVDSDCSNPCSEKSGSLEMSSGMESAPAQSEVKAISFALFPNVTDTSDTSKALDLSIKENSFLDQGSLILDLSLKNSNAENFTSDPQVIEKETSVSGEQKEATETLKTVKPSMGRRKWGRKSVHSTEIINEVNDVMGTNESKRTCTPLQKPGRLEHTDVPSFKCGGTVISVQEEIENVSIQPEIHQTASVIGHVLHGCHNKKTDMKDGIENSEATKMSTGLVQKQGMDSSKSAMEKEVDSNKKAGDVHTIEHDKIESEDGENCEVKEKPYQEGNVELSPKLIHTGDDSTKEESGIVCNGNLLENEKQLTRKEPKAVSSGKTENVPVHEDKMIEDDHFGKLDGLDHKDRFNPVLEADSDLNDQPIPMICDGPDLAKKDRITECNGQSSLDEHSRQTDIEEDACHDLQLRKLCANVNALPDEHAISVKALSEMKPNNNEPAAEETSENDGCLADFSDQSLPMMCDGPDSVKDCVTECNRQVAMDEQPPQADIGEDACHDLQLRKLCANGNALKDAHANSEIAPHNPLEMEHIHNEPTVKESSENYICLANLSDQPLPTMCDGQDLAKKDYITEFNLQAPLVEQPPQADNKKGACHDLQLRKLCADGSELTEEHAISDKTPHGSSEMEPIYNEPAVEQNSENGICLADLSDQTLPVMCDGPESVQNDCITECNRQAALDDQPPQADKKKGACHDLQSRKLFTEVSALTEEHAISDKIPHGPSEMEPIHNEPAVVENSENVTCLANLSDQPLPVMYDGPDSVQKDCITECNLQAPLDEQPPQADKGEDARHALQSRKLCANGSALTDERAISVKAPHAPSEMGPIHNEPVIEETSENDVCLADLSDQPLPMMCDGLDSVQKDGTIKECNRQAPLDEQPPKADIEDYKCHDMQLRKLCANGSALTDEHAISEKAPHTLSEMEPIYNEPAVEETSENHRCLADLSDQPLPMMFDGQDSVKDSVTECNRQVPLDEQPPQADIEEDVCHDLQLRKLCANGSTLTDGHAISEKAPHNLSEMEPIYNEPVVEEMSENYICLADKALPVSDESPCSLDGSFADGSIPQTNDSVETGIQNKIMGKVNLSSDEHEDWDTKSVKGEQNTTQKELFHHHSHSTWFEAVTRCEAEVALTKETDLNGDNTNKGFENTHSQVVIPFIGIDTSREDVLQPHDLHSEGKLEEVQGQKEIPFISDTTYPETILSTEACSTSQMYSKKAELSARKILSLIETSKTNQTEVSESESDDRCPTPTMDEKPYQNATSSCSVPSSRSSTSAFSASVTCKNMTLKCLSRSSTLTKDKMPLEQKDKSTVNSGPNPHHVLHPDLELRTLRVLQSIKFFSKSSQNDKSSQIKTVDMKHSLDQTPHTSSKYIPTYLGSSHTSAGLQDKKINSTKPAVMPTSTSQELHTESSDHFLISPFKSKLDEILGVKLQLKKTDSSEHQRYFDKMDKLQETSVGQDYCHPQRSFASSECLQAIKPITDQDEHKTTSQTNLSHEPRSYSQRPVMAVKPSKSDEIQADYICKDREIENSVMSFFSKNKQTKPPVVTYTPASMLLEKKTEGLKGNSAGVNDYRQEASELSSTSSWLSNSDSNSDLDKAKCALLDSLYLYEVRNISSFNKMPSSFTVQSSESGKTSSKLVDGNQSFLTNSSVENIEQTTKESFEIDQKHCAHASTSFVDYKNESLIDDSLSLGPQSSLMCTVYNTSQKRCKSFLEQISQRCLQDDLTQASMEQECLIFSEQMKQLLKRSNRGPINQRDAHDKLNLSRSSPVTVHFSSLEEQEDSVDHLDAWPLVGQKIKVDMSDRKDLAHTTEEEKTLHLQGIGNPMEHAGVSSVTADCARLYTAMMNDVCAVKKVPSRPKHFRMDRGYTKTEPSNHFDFCDQMKREMDESFRSNLNSVVKKFCKTKYRFYILVTSDGAFFEETKAHLEAEGHTAVQPSEFFLGEDSSSSLLIILRNEDIAEHICEVPHLIELKKSPDVQFAGIDEPDDVVNLTHQELFMRGGFIMFDRAALESLSLSDMKQMSEILQELSRKGKWKWMLHYRDSRRLKENARLSAEAKEKKHFLNWCQEFGLLEVLPYHECDLASKDQPDYLTCLVRLQVQNISARYPVFITETTTESTFETNGILTMTFNSFLTCSPSETFTVK